MRIGHLLPAGSPSTMCSQVECQCICRGLTGTCLISPVLVPSSSKMAPQASPAGVQQRGEGNKERGFGGLSHPSCVPAVERCGTADIPAREDATAIVVLTGHRHGGSGAFQAVPLDLDGSAGIDHLHGRRLKGG